MQNPLVSVIIPNYCHARYLDQRIQSVLNQTYHNFEVIILDDCSPDNGASKAVIEKYRDNSYIAHIVYNEKNSGSTFRQWHKGFELAKGDLIWIAESDDYCEIDLLETLVNGFCSHENVAIAYCASIIVDGKGQQRDKNIICTIPSQLYNGHEFIGKYMSWINSIPNASAAIFRRDYALQIDKQYMEFVAAGDRLFWIELCEFGNVYHSSKPMNYFRKHGDNVTPRCFRCGITTTEDYRINRYLERKKIISLMTALGARCHYLSCIKNNDFSDFQIKKNLLHMWSCHGLFSLKILSYLLRCYNYYILRNKVL